jgi:uncharacterized protein
VPLTTTWVIKLSKFCNMRCRYCYEWNELADRARISMALWERILAAVVDHHATWQARIDRQWPGVEHRSLIVLHGGEPLALPSEYLAQALALFDQMRRRAPGTYQLSVQSNLLSVTREKLDLLLERGAQLSVSFDLVPGVRLNVAGQPTEEQVSRNIEMIRALGVPLGAIAVLAKHTLGHVTRIHDYFAERGMPMRILPLFDGPAERDLPSFWLDHAALRRGLEALFRHWIETGCRIPVYPLMGYFEAALRHMAGLYRPLWRRELHGDSIFIVNQDGRLYRLLDAYEKDLALGNLAVQDMASISGSQAYERSLARDRAEFAAHCEHCEYLGACNGSPLYSSRVTTPYAGLCPSAHACISFMIDYVKEQGYGPAELRALLDRIRSPSPLFVGGRGGPEASAAASPMTEGAP